MIRMIPCARAKFVHTPEEFTTKVSHGGKIQLKGEIVCCAETFYSEPQLIEWSNYFQKIFVFMLKTIAVFHPMAFETESGKLAVDNLIEPEIKDLEGIEVAKEIKDILSQLPK